MSCDCHGGVLCDNHQQPHVLVSEDQFSTSRSSTNRSKRLALPEERSIHSDFHAALCNTSADIHLGASLPDERFAVCHGAPEKSFAQVCPMNVAIGFERQVIRPGFTEYQRPALSSGNHLD